MKYPEQRDYAIQYANDYARQNDYAIQFDFNQCVQYANKKLHINLWCCSQDKIEDCVEQFVDYLITTDRAQRISIQKQKQEAEEYRIARDYLFNQFHIQNPNRIYEDSLCVITISPNPNKYIIGTIQDKKLNTLEMPFDNIASIVAYKDMDICIEHTNVVHTYAGETSMSIGGFGGGVIHTNDDIVTSYEPQQCFSGIIKIYTKDFKVYSLRVERVEIVEALKAYLSI